ncbi:serine hydrolase domain-containing protein [Limosilactobacillus difficilis]|uniref:serine hydrolase domain-containing protein n=1 Tax=Limosilactobacillus difficilis TaxID=2991838 RepID=UPI0024B92368|nr:serine hydrolase [Limosilactobacillus difficilis]
MGKKLWLALGCIFLCICWTTTASANIGQANSRRLREAKRIKRTLHLSDANAIVMISNRSGDEQPMTVRNRSWEVHRQDQLITPHRLYPIASLQKVFTGLLTQRLVQQQRLSLQSRLDRYYPTVPFASQITVERLMTHTSGCADVKSARRHYLPTEADQMHYVLRHVKVKDSFSWHYSNADFAFLSGIISRISGKPYHQVLRQQLWQPLGLHMKFYNEVGPGQVVRAVHPAMPTWRTIRDDMGATPGSAEVFSSPADYWKFLNWLSSGSPSPLSRLMAHTHQPIPYYGGIYNYHGLVHANGYVDGYFCTFYVHHHERMLLMTDNLSFIHAESLSNHIFHDIFPKNHRH